MTDSRKEPTEERLWAKGAPQATEGNGMTISEEELAKWGAIPDFVTAWEVHRLIEALRSSRQRIEELERAQKLNRLQLGRDIDYARQALHHTPKEGE